MVHSYDAIVNGNSSSGTKASKSSCRLTFFRKLIAILTITGCLYSLVLLKQVASHHSKHNLDATVSHLHNARKEFSIGAIPNDESKGDKSPANGVNVPKRRPSSSKGVSNATAANIPSNPLPLGFRHVLERAIRHQKICNDLNKTVDVEPSPTNATRKTQEAQEKPGGSNETQDSEAPPSFADLPDLGIIHALSSYRPKSEEEAQKWSQCRVPPPNECNVTKFTVIFLAHNPERLNHMGRMIGQMTSQDTEWAELVEEVVIVWNGERDLKETTRGANLELMSTQRNLRIVYPLKEGHPNDLLNRYNPDLVKVKTKAILYYDDDGPFYSFSAVRGGFELWKRNSNAQIGAMARRLDVGPRQVQEKEGLFEGLSDKHFVSHCRSCGDSVFYNFFIFANFGANMVLPSGSFLHSDFLCFVWHPALEELRQFVRDHVVHPDDATVSMVVSQVAGRAPMVYPRRINKKKDRRRLRALTDTLQNTTSSLQYRNSVWNGQAGQQRRKLLWEQKGWGDMRNSAMNSLVAYFGGLNSGSLGWCYGTEHHKVTGKKKENVCDPEMAVEGMLSWMTETHEPRPVCP